MKRTKYLSMLVLAVVLAFGAAAVYAQDTGGGPHVKVIDGAVDPSDGGITFAGLEAPADDANRPAGGGGGDIVVFDIVGAHDAEAPAGGGGGRGGDIVVFDIIDPSPQDGGGGVIIEYIIVDCGGDYCW